MLTEELEKLELAAAEASILHDKLVAAPVEPRLCAIIEVSEVFEHLVDSALPSELRFQVIMVFLVKIAAMLRKFF